MTARAAAAALCVALLAVGCSSRQQEGTTPLTPSPSEPVAATAEALPQPGDRCGFPDRHAEVFRFPAADGVELDGAVIGTGTTGVVMANQSNSSLCGWWPFASHLADQGFRVLLFDFRCAGLSSCPDGDARGDYPSDLTGAAAALRSKGAKDVALLGASLGANVAMVAGPSITPSPSAVLSLSGPADLTGLLGDERLDAFKTVPHLTSPFLQMVAREDTVAFVPDIRKLAATAGSKVTRVVILDASYGHGWDMVSNAAGEPTDVAHVVVDFLKAHH